MSSKFGDFIKEKRKEKRLSLRKMAEQLDISPSYWSDIEKGRRNPPQLDMIEKIVNVLNLSEEEKDQIIDLASEERGEIPMDLPSYINSSEIAKVALRKASKVEGEDKRLDEAWRNFIKEINE